MYKIKLSPFTRFPLFHSPLLSSANQMLMLECRRKSSGPIKGPIDFTFLIGCPNGRNTTQCPHPLVPSHNEITLPFYCIPRDESADIIEMVLVSPGLLFSPLPFPKAKGRLNNYVLNDDREGTTWTFIYYHRCFVSKLHDLLSLNEVPLNSLSFVVVSCVPLVTNTYEITACCLCRADGFMALRCV